MVKFTIKEIQDPRVLAINVDFFKDALDYTMYYHMKNNYSKPD